MITRRQFLAGAAAASLAGCRREQPRPNILFLMPDQFRGMDLGVMGNADVHTPNMDRLASQGALFRNTVANCPVCCPARATLLTGKFAHHHGVAVNDAPLPDEEVTIAEILKEQGYRTGFVGKWHLEGGIREPGYVPPGPRRQGFDFWAAHICSHDYWNMHYFRDDPTPIPIEGYSARAFTDEALRFLNQDKETPFCLYLEWGPPHNPYVAPPEYMNLYDPEMQVMRQNWQDGVWMGGRNDIAGYYAAITFLDEEIGRILKTLEENGQTENTIILLTSDHGDMLGSQGTFLKRKPWEESIKVPGILRYPARVEAGLKLDFPFSHVDMPPTLLALAGSEVPEFMEGQNLAGNLLAPASASSEPESAYLQSYTPTERDEFPPWRGVRTSRYTFARHADRPWMLYDNEQDPYQLDNWAGKPEHAELEARLDKMTMDWFEKTRDDWHERKDMPYE